MSITGIVWKITFYISSVQALDNVEQRLGINETALPVSLKTSYSTPDLEETQGCITYLLDTFNTLHNFVSVYPPAAAICHKKELHLR